MAKKRKYPKKPRGLSLIAWTNYDRKRKAVDTYNRGLESERKKVLSIKKKYA